MHRALSRGVIASLAVAASGCASSPAASPAPAAAPPVAASAPAPCTDTTRLVVVTTTDVHGRLRGWDYELNRPDAIRGLTRAATVVDSIRDANPGRVLLLDAGDLLQGNMLAYVGARVSPDTTTVAARVSPRIASGRFSS
jgi:2',3'-cyclic-nucleotide 2'-phosphodiesterase (5'-nucleotidase family)